MIRHFLFGAGITLALAVTSPMIAADAEISAADAAKHVGETAVVTGTVDDVGQASGGNIFLNFGGRRQEAVFTAFIPAGHADEFKDFKSYKDKTVSVSGKIEEHKSKPEIVVTSASQITVKDSAASSSASPAASASPK